MANDEHLRFLPTIEAGEGKSIGPPPPAGGLGIRAARGASVMLSGQVARMIIQVGSVAVLARLLDAIDYGLIAIVLAIIGAGEILRDFGLSAAAVQAENLDRHQRDKLLWCSTAIGGVLTCVVFACAPAISSIFDQPELIPITRALSITFLINGVTGQYRADLNRRMKFGSIIVTDVSAQVLGVGTAVAIAVSGGGYWSLVAQQLVQASALLISLAIIAGWIPRYPPKGTSVGPMLRYGRNLMGAQLIGYLGNNVDTFTVGLRFGPNELGIYNRGFQLLMRPLVQLRAPTTTVALPVLSRIRDDYQRAGQYVITGQLALGYTLVAALAYAAGAADPLIHLFLGSEWSAVAPIFALLAVAGAFETLSYVGSWVYLSRGLTHKLFQYSLVSLAIKVSGVLIGSTWGVVGVAGGYAAAPAISFTVSLWWLSRLTALPTRQLWLGALRIIVCAALAGAACRASVFAMSSQSQVVQLIVGGVSLFCVYAFAILAFHRIRADFRVVLTIIKKARTR